jgi:D-amino peptidase
MIVWICTDMEGLAGLDQWEQCGHPEDDAPAYLYGRDQLTADTNAAIAGCFDAGATEVRVLDGHGRNRFKGFTEALDPRAVRVGVAQRGPIRWEGLSDEVHAVAMVGQHAMAGTLHGFLDHTQRTKVICRVTLDGQEIGEMSQCALYAGSFGVPLVYVSGDEALCAEARRLYPHVATTPTKRGTGWATCELYPVDEVRAGIRADIARALSTADRGDALRLSSPAEVAIEWAWSELADQMAALPGVRRPHARTTAWTMTDQRDIYTWPSPVG